MCKSAWCIPGIPSPRQARIRRSFRVSPLSGPRGSRFEDAAYTTSDASIGLEKDDWTFSAYGQNITNSHAIVFTSTDNFIVAQTPIRPRVLGARFTYSF